MDKVEPLCVWFLERSSHHKVFIVVVVLRPHTMTATEKKEIRSPTALCPARSAEGLYSTEWLLCLSVSLRCLINRMCFSINSIKAIHRRTGLCEVRLRESSRGQTAPSPCRLGVTLRQAPAEAHLGWPLAVPRPGSGRKLRRPRCG